jgi:hypothetical protein
MALIQANQLNPGDILLKENTGTGTHKLIKFGQWLGAKSDGHHNIAHAAIVVSQPNVCESVKEGVRMYTIGGDHCVYHAFRYINRTDIAELASDVGHDIAMRRMSGNDPDADYGEYATTKATKSAFRKADMDPTRNRTGEVADRVHSFLDDLENGIAKARRFMCSNFVVLCYSVASEALSNNPHYAIALDFERTSPGELYSYCDSSVWWQNVGWLNG